MKTATILFPICALAVLSGCATGHDAAIGVIGTGEPKNPNYVPNPAPKPAPAPAATPDYVLLEALHNRALSSALAPAPK